MQRFLLNPSLRRTNHVLSVLAMGSILVGSNTIKQRQPVGIPNIGNTSYLSSSLQCLVSCHGILDTILNHRMDKSSPSEKSLDGMQQLCHHLVAPSFSVIDPSTVGAIHSQFQDAFPLGESHDPLDFLTAFVDHMSSKIHPKSNLLGLIHESSFTCSCGRQSTPNSQHEPFTVVPLDHLPTTSTSDGSSAPSELLHQNYFLQPHMNKVEGYRCPHVNPFQTTTTNPKETTNSSIDIITSYVPTNDHFAVVLERNQWDSTLDQPTHVRSPVALPFYLHFSDKEARAQPTSTTSANIAHPPFTSSLPATTYQLQGFITSRNDVESSVQETPSDNIHRGTSCDGDFVAYCNMSPLCLKNDWYFFDGTCSRYIEYEQVVQASNSAYIAFYSKSDQHAIDQIVRDGISAQESLNNNNRGYVTSKL